MKTHANGSVFLWSILTTFAVLALCTLPVSAAQYSAAPAVQNVTCESNNGSRQHCGSYTVNQINLQRQVSQSPCVRNQSWGVDRQGLWVDRGCRAVFAVRNASAPGPGPGGPGPGRPGAGGPGWVHPVPGNPWPPSGNWNGGNWGNGGACFYKGYGFTGDYFCMRRGESRPSLGSYGGTISSIRVFGGARVTVFNDRDYRNGQDTTTREVSDLRNWRMSTRPSHTWNNRISSLQVQ